MASVVDNFQANFSTIAQDFLNRTYLQPFKGPLKRHVKNGLIERETHGAMHACRVAAYVRVVHHKMTEMIPKATKRFLDEIAKALGLSHENILTLLTFAALCHDSAREADGPDLWDEESGKKCIEELVARGIDKKIASIFAYAAINKDKPKDYEQFLLKNGFSQNQIPSFQYLRKLIFLPDCFDIQRTRDIFRMKFVYSAFSDIPEYQPKIHNQKLVNFAVAIHQFIVSQHDMKTPCKIELANGKKLKLPVKDYNLVEKLKCEHADNVFETMVGLLKKDQSLSQYVSSVKLPSESVKTSVANTSANTPADTLVNASSQTTIQSKHNLSSSVDDKSNNKKSVNEKFSIIHLGIIAFSVAVLIAVKFLLLQTYLSALFCAFLIFALGELLAHLFQRQEEDSTKNAKPRSEKQGESQDKSISLSPQGAPLLFAFNANNAAIQRSEMGVNPSLGNQPEKNAYRCG